MSKSDAPFAPADANRPVAAASAAPRVELELAPQVLATDPAPDAPTNHPTPHEPASDPSQQAPVSEPRADTPASSAAPEAPSSTLPPETPVSSPAAEAPASSAVHPLPPVLPPLPTERRHPLRFVWQIDDAGRFTLGSDEFVALIGPRTAAALGLTWLEIAAELGLDPEGRVAQALATHETWSGLTVGWPLDNSVERLPIELSGLPVFDRTRVFRGYRGFGVCRDMARLAELPHRRSEASTTATEVETPAAPAASDPPDAPASVAAFPAAAEPDRPALSAIEHHAFRELSRRLTQHLSRQDAEPHGATATADGDDAAAAAAVPDGAPAAFDPGEPPVADHAPSPMRSAVDDAVSGYDEEPPIVSATTDARPFLDRLPFGVLVYRLSHLLYANRPFLQWSGYESVEALAQAGGLDSLFVEPGAVSFEKGGEKPFAITGSRGEKRRAEGRLFLVPWDGESAFALLTIPVPEAQAQSEEPAPAAAAALARAQAEAAELGSILDTATDGVVLIDQTGLILSSNRSAEALFGYASRELAGASFFELFAPESLDIASAYFEGLRQDGAGSLINGGRDVIGRVRQGGLIPLFMTMGRLGESSDKLCAVFRDLTAWKKAEEELTEARRRAEKASSAKSQLLAKISHEIRTPLNAIIGFSELMMEQRFGPVGNERYRAYLKDIHTSGGHLISLINDLLDLSKIEAGKLELSLAGVALNDLTQQCVAIMQPQANRERIIIRTSLAPRLPQIVADARSVRQIVLNLLSNSIRFTGAGGQVIVSTALTESGEVVLRVRDTGIGMSESDIATALEPFRQLATSGRGGSGGTGLGLPLTKALAEANSARFQIKSALQEGTLVEVAFPAAPQPAG